MGFWLAEGGADVPRVSGNCHRDYEAVAIAIMYFASFAVQPKMPRTQTFFATSHCTAVLHIALMHSDSLAFTSVWDKIEQNWFVVMLGSTGTACIVSLFSQQLHA